MTDYDFKKEWLLWPIEPVMLKSRTWLRRHLSKRDWKNYLRWERNRIKHKEVKE